MDLALNNLQWLICYKTKPITIIVKTFGLVSLFNSVSAFVSYLIHRDILVDEL